MAKARMRTTMKRSWEYWTVLVLGLFYVATKCDARAVNVSNSWTMPQEGLNVFYRFFRDRISWFEADAVCQFHHAYLVTVDNSFQFDATRDLLRELDVNDIVWIGLMRPQSSDRFMWSNSRSLAANTGYWAESLPLMESPLCAVIDPIRDYRWHALRCGGPETASFLCEMPVPTWAEACILKDLPSLTMQYMADTASVELIRNCGEEGLIRQMCRGKQDRERIMRELLCPRERLESKKLSDITNSHFKSLQIIRGISTDNNENNDIEMIPMKIGGDTTEQVQTEKNTVQKLIEQFNVDELMQADQPSRIPGEIPMPVKKSAKKIAVAIQTKKPTQPPRKSSSRGHHREPEPEEMMMGDQPIPDDASNEIFEPLPHIKKVLPQDLKPMPTIKSTTIIEPATTTTSTVAVAIDETTTTMPVTSTELPVTPDETTFEFTTISGGLSTTPVITTDSAIATSAPSITSGSSITSGPSIIGTTAGILPVTQVATIGHPMHPQQQRSNIITEETNHPHVKETNDNHFIPPMLLVKSHYVPPPKGYANHWPHSVSQDLTGITGIRDDDDESPGTTIENVHQEEPSLQQQTTIPSAPQWTGEVEKSVRLEVAHKEVPTNSSEIQLQATTTARNEATTRDASASVFSKSSTIKPATSPESETAAAAAAAATAMPTERITEIVITTTGSGDVSSSSSSSNNSPLQSSLTISTNSTQQQTTPAEVTSSPAFSIHTIDTQTEEQNKQVTEKTELQPTPSLPLGNSGDSLSSSLSTNPSTDGPGIISTTTATTTKATATAASAVTGAEAAAAPHPTRNFLNEETYPPFKPNRRRSLTKPDTPSYFKKILG